MSRDIAPFGLRMPIDLKARIDEVAQANGRSINAEVIARLQTSFVAEKAFDLADIDAGVLLHEVIERYGARLQIIIAPEIAQQAGIGAAPA
jgi:hypothetical protein